MTSLKQSEDSETRLRNVLTEIARSAPGVKVLVVGDPSGLPIATLARGARTQAATAMATLLLSAAQRVTANLELVGSAAVIIEGGDWCVVVNDLGEGFSLLGVVDGGANVAAAKQSIRYRLSLLTEILHEMR